MTKYLNFSLNCLLFLALLSQSFASRNYLTSYEVLDNDYRFSLELNFSQPVTFTRKDVKRNGPPMIQLGIPGVKSSVLKGRQSLDHMLAISFYVEQGRRGVKIKFYPRNFFPVKTISKNGGRTLEISVENLYPLRSELDPLNQKFLICIDPGHGGHDPGAQGKEHEEKTVNLEMARVLRDEINKSNDLVAFLTREKDYKIKLEDRPKISDRASADLFISLHMNASTPPTRGFEIFFLSDKGADQNLKNNLTETEKKGDSKTPRVLNHILLDLKQMETVNQSSRFAHFLEKSLKALPKGKSRGVHRQEFVVLKTLDTPSVLIEMGFITNRRDSTFLTSWQGKRAFSFKLIEGIRNYLKESELRPKQEVKLNARLHSKKVEVEKPVPPKARTVYKVQSGDTFIKIAKKFKIPYKKLMAANPGVTPKKLFVGKKIKIP